jgi:hypothetical protein
LSAEELRSAILAQETRHHGSFHGTGGQVGTFGKQLRKYSRDARAVVRARVLRDGSGRDLGYPVMTERPPAGDAEWTSIRPGDDPAAAVLEDERRR